MHGCKTHFTWKFPLKTRFEWMLRSCLATFYYKASHNAPESLVNCSALRPGDLPRRSGLPTTRARALVESQEADETTKLRKTANFHLFPNALVFVKILCCAFADALLLIISSDELTVIAALARRSCCNISSECHDFHLAQTRTPSTLRHAAVPNLRTRACLLGRALDKPGTA